jgi:hypothetical protein
MVDSLVPPSLQQILRAIGSPSVTLRTPVTDDQLNEPPGPNLRLIFRDALTAADLDRVVAYAAGYASVAVCIARGMRDLSVLRRLPPVTRFVLRDHDFDAFDQFEHLPDDLGELILDQTRSRRLSLGVLRRFKSLHTLHVERHARDIEAIGELPALRELTLRSITLPDLSVLRPLAHLQSLDLKLGGTKDLRLLAQIGKLRYFEAWQVKGLADLEPVAHLPHLQRLRLESLVQVRALPSFAGLGKLRRAEIISLKNVSDLAPVAAAPALEQLHAADLGAREPEAFAIFRGHPTLRAALIGTGSKAKNRAIEQLLGLPNIDDHFEYVA